MASLIKCTQKQCKKESKEVDKEIAIMKQKMATSKDIMKLVDDFNNSLSMKNRNDCVVKKCLKEVKEDLKNIVKLYKNECDKNKTKCDLFKRASKMIKETNISETDYTKFGLNVNKII